MSEPRTAREALIAQMLGELDELLRRAERLPEAIADAEKRVATSVQVLDEAGDRYRLAVTTFTEEAKLTLTDYLRSKALETVALTADEQREVLQEAARSAIQLDRSQGKAQRNIRCGQLQHECQCSRWARWLEHGLTALLTSVLTATFVLWIVTLS